MDQLYSSSKLYLKFTILQLYFSEKVYYFLNRIFSEQPAVQQKYFKHMDKSDMVGVSRHGLKFMHALDKMISLVGSGDDDELVAAIHGV